MQQMDIYRKYYSRYKIQFISGVIFVSLEAFCNLMQPTIMARIIDDGVKSGNLNMILKYGLLMLL
ncbi:MAG: hypothetical protein ACRCZU_03460, partial [Selenomonadaceae bacterium]